MNAKKKKPKPKWTQEKQDLLAKYDSALRQIERMGDGIPSNHIDWNNIGKNAKHVAKEALYVKCKECGK